MSLIKQKQKQIFSPSSPSSTQNKQQPSTPSQTISQSKSQKKRANSQKKYQQAPDIMTQARPSYLTNFAQPINPHQSAFTPTNKSNKLNAEELLLPKKTSEFLNKKTLILDLDETLVHSSFTPFEKNDIILNVDFEGVMYNIYVLVRPDAIDFIKEISQYYEVVIFTASISKYANPLLDILDKEKNIKYRLFRDHCTFINGIYIKDLKRLNRYLKDLIIVDNSPLAYAFDSENGLPIKTWYDDPEDKELVKLIPILQFLAKVNDVRTYIEKFVLDNEIIFEEAYEIINNELDSDINSLTESLNNINENNNINNNINNVNVNKINDINSQNNQMIELLDKDLKAISVNINLNMKIKNNGINQKKERANSKTLNIKESKKNNDNTNNNFLPNKTTNNFNSKKEENIKEIPVNTRQNNIPNQKKKNAFRFGPKPSEKITSSIGSKIGLNNINVNNSKYTSSSSSIPLSLSLSNTTKNFLSSKQSFQFPNNNININNNYPKNFTSFSNKSKIKNNKENEKNSQNNNNNIIKSMSLKEIIYDKNNGNITKGVKKFSYTNLLEKFEARTIKSQSQTHNSIPNSSNNNTPTFSRTQTANMNNPTKNRNSFQLKSSSNTNNTNNNINSNASKPISGVKRPNHLRVSSSINSFGSFFQFQENGVVKPGTSFHVMRSKSSSNFLNFNNKYSTQHPKTPKAHHLGGKPGVGEVKKENKIFNFLDGMAMSKTTRNKGMNNGQNKFDQIYKKKKSNRIKV